MSSNRALALQLAVAAYGPSTSITSALNFLNFLEGENVDPAVSNPPVKDAASSKAKATTKKATQTSTETAPATTPAAETATAPAASESTGKEPLAAPAGQTAEAYQSEVAALTLSTAKIDVERVRGLLREFKAERFGQVSVKDYPAYYAKLKVLAEQIAAEQKAKASSPESLV